MRLFILITILLALTNGWKFNFIDNNMIKLSKNLN